MSELRLVTEADGSITERYYDTNGRLVQKVTRIPRATFPSARPAKRKKRRR